MNIVINDINNDVRNWWISLVLGFVFIIIALCLMFTPVAEYITLSVLFSIAILISGIMEIIFAISNRKTFSSWGWYLAGGIVDLIVGIYLVAYPWISMEIVPYLVAFWLLFRGFTLCGYASDLRHVKVRAWGWYLSFGILSILCSLAIFWLPVTASFYLYFMLAFALLIIGIFRVIFSFELKILRKKDRPLSVS